VRIALDAVPEPGGPEAELFLVSGGMSGLVAALETAWDSARICKQNAVAFGGAATTNLAMALVQVAPPPLSSLINAAAMAASGGNSLRPLMRTPRRGDVRRLPEVIPAEGSGR
jgi:cation transport ATPase